MYQKEVMEREKKHPKKTPYEMKRMNRIERKHVQRMP